MTDLKTDLRKQLIRDEGVRKHAYKDSLGYLTIGVGRLVDKAKGGGLRDNEIEFMLDNDIQDRIAELNRVLPWLSNLSEARQGVLLNMSFQLGIEGVLNFKNTLSLIKQGLYKEASDNMLKSLWAKQTPERAARLAKQMSTNEWQ